MNELERATATHRQVAENLRAQVSALVLDHESGDWRAAARERHDDDAAFGQYPFAARLIGPFEVSVGGTAAYLLNPALRCWVDVPEYSATCRLGHRCFETGDLTQAITAYLYARRLYRGPLLEGDTSGEWFRDDELRLRDQHHTVLERLGTGLLRHGELSASVDVARELVSADPCRKLGISSLCAATRRFSSLSWWSVSTGIASTCCAGSFPSSRMRQPAPSWKALSAHNLRNQ